MRKAVLLLTCLFVSVMGVVYTNTIFGDEEIGLVLPDNVVIKSVDGDGPYTLDGEDVIPPPDDPPLESCRNNNTLEEGCCWEGDNPDNPAVPCCGDDPGEELTGLAEPNCCWDYGQVDGPAVPCCPNPAMTPPLCCTHEATGDPVECCPDASDPPCTGDDDDDNDDNDDNDDTTKDTDDIIEVYKPIQTIKLNEQTRGGTAV